MQTTRASSGFEAFGKTTRKAAFLARMQTLKPSSAFIELIEPCYPKADNGRPPRSLHTVLRMYCIANWFDLSDVACEDTLYDTDCFRSCCCVDLGREGVSDATTLLHFRHLMERHNLGSALFSKVGELLQANGLQLCGGTIVDATIIAAPSSTKNQDKARDREMHQTKKGNQWYFGMKVHIGVESASGLAHSASVTPANVDDSQELGSLLHGAETPLYGDSAYRGQNKALKEYAPRARDFTNKRAYRNKPLSGRDKDVNTTKSRIRAFVEHPFLTLKRNWGFAKARYRGLAKNANRAFAMLVLVTIDKWATPLGA